MNRSLVRFEYEKSPIHTIVYGGTGTGKTYFIRQYLQLYLDLQSGYDLESGLLYIGFKICDINMITSKNKSKFKDSVIVLDDVGDKLNKDIAYYFTEGRHYKIQMIVMCHKPAQIINTARMSCDTIYLTTYNGAYLFNNFNEKYKCEHNFNKIISELNSNYYNCT